MVGKYIGFVFIAFWGLFTIFSPIAHAASLFDYNMNLSKENLTGIIIMEIGQERFFVNGNEANGDKPFVEHGHTMAPLRTIGEAFGELYLKNWGSGISEYPFKSYNPYDGSPSHWYNISGKEYLVFHNEPEGASYDYIYLFKDGKLKLVYSEAIFDIKFTNDSMYILVSGPGIDRWFAVDEHSNLLKVSLQDYTGEYIGVKGYVYGCILKEEPNGSFMLERDNWQIKDDGIYISGFYDLGTSDFKEKGNNTGRYKVSLTSQSHEKLTP